MPLRSAHLVAMLLVTFSLGLLVGISFHLPSSSSELVVSEPVEVPHQWLSGREPLASQTAASKEEDVIRRLVNGAYWTTESESLVPKGFTPDALDSWKDALQFHKVVDIKEGCGRMQNRKIQMEDGSRACVRYRINNDQIMGDILSFHLSQLLHIYQVPPSVLSLADPRNWTWEGVSGEVAAAQWHHERPVIVTPWVNDLSPVYIPRELQGSSGGLPRQLHPTASILINKTENELRELVQWSDLIIFDYLTANLDRVVNNMFNHQWNADMMISPTHNLEGVASSGLLVFLDNEAGLLHGYRLLDKYQSYHETLLGSLCIFKTETAQKIKEFVASDESLGQALTTAFESSDPLHHLLPRLPPKNVKILQSRLRQVHDQIIRCEGIQVDVLYRSLPVCCCRVACTTQDLRTKSPLTINGILRNLLVTDR
ncbi:hypothetical protein CAPTEDRAFT_221135 [Capitella teleta]|uniref:FAM20 C-terminal domain-containing protein n=1 Tax=Capitella teleta TaxID=283909 RepID=R7URZ9_CAPTE|nr:hypothetical protein CAPTEDRAFT_221135 [Capitella teleta]|eukprot:ELU09294.1 hypothetical protein CAPTEDRAFT_221135 [Capitella teleta]